MNNVQEKLIKDIYKHLYSIGFSFNEEGNIYLENYNKETIRNAHKSQREDYLRNNEKFLVTKIPLFSKHFACGKDIKPSKISPVIECVSSTFHKELFRFASLTWSVPVSNGFGRRLRYLVRDEYNGKLIGIIALGDPVFHLGVRDNLIGWNSKDRSKRLVNIMDAFVLGAVPPYNQLLGGKMIACLLRSQEIYNDFISKYGNTKGIISKDKKQARLLAITTLSSMGRSSVYNRLKLNGIQYMKSYGFTSGYGHFHISNDLFLQLHNYLKIINHKSAKSSYSQRTNWRFRIIKAAFDELNIKKDLLHHGIEREFFICRLAINADEILKSGTGKPDISNLLPIKDVAELAIERWVKPRAKRRKDYKNWTIDNLISLFGSQSCKMSLNLKNQPESIFAGYDE